MFLEGEGRETRRETSMCETSTDCLLQNAPNWGPSPQPRNVPWLGIEPATVWFAGQHSIHWATSAIASEFILFYFLLLLPEYVTTLQGSLVENRACLKGLVSLWSTYLDLGLWWSLPSVASMIKWPADLTAVATYYQHPRKVTECLSNSQESLWQRRALIPRQLCATEDQKPTWALEFEGWN